MKTPQELQKEKEEKAAKKLSKETENLKGVKLDFGKETKGDDKDKDKDKSLEKGVSELNIDGKTSSNSVDALTKVQRDREKRDEKVGMLDLEKPEEDTKMWCKKVRILDDKMKPLWPNEVIEMISAGSLWTLEIALGGKHPDWKNWPAREIVAAIENQVITAKVVDSKTVEQEVEHLTKLLGKEYKSNKPNVILQFVNCIGTKVKNEGQSEQTDERSWNSKVGNGVILNKITEVITLHCNQTPLKILVDEITSEGAVISPCEGKIPLNLQEWFSKLLQKCQEIAKAEELIERMSKCVPRFTQNGSQQHQGSQNGSSKGTKRKIEPDKEGNGKFVRGSTEGYTPCKQCGKTHPGECKLSNHPDVNTTDMPFAKSAVGLKYQKFNDGKTPVTLDFRKKLNAAGTALVDHKHPTSGEPKKDTGKCDNDESVIEQSCTQKCLCTMEARDTQVSRSDHILETRDAQAPRSGQDDGEMRDAKASRNQTVTTLDEDVIIELSDVTVKCGDTVCSVCLDTGSNLYNYISCRKAAEIRATLKLPSFPCVEYVRLANKDEVRLVEYIIVPQMCVQNKVKSAKCFNEVKMYVFDTTHDIILGRPEIKKNNVLKEILFKSLLDDKDFEKIHETLLIEKGKKAALKVQEEKYSELLESFKKHHDFNAEKKEKVDKEGLSCLSNIYKTLEEFFLKEKTQTTNELLNIHADGQAEVPGIIEGSDSFKARQKDLCEKYKDVFSSKLRFEAANVPPMELKVEADSWRAKANQRPPNPQGKGREEEIEGQAMQMLEANVIRLSTASQHSQVLLTPKPDGTWRFCIDYRRLNASTESEHWPIPNIEKMLRRVGDQRPKFFAVLDLTKGYYQAPLSESAKQYTAFITMKALYEWNRVPMGLKGAPSYFQRIMVTVVLSGLVYSICECYMDDILIHGKTEEEYLLRLEQVFQRLRKHKLTVNPKKCKLGLQQVEYVGHIIDHEGITFDRERLQEIIDFKVPETKGELKSMLGVANYLRDNIRNMSILTAPLSNLLVGYTRKQRNHKLAWNQELTGHFEKFKEAVNGVQKLFYVDEKGEIHLFTDASNEGIGAYLCQMVDGKERVIAFMSRTLNKTQKGYSTHEKEALAIVEALKKFKYLLSDVKFKLHTDHENLVYIRDTGSPKVIGWKCLIQEFDYDLAWLKGEDNIIADYWSRNSKAKVLEEEESSNVKTDLTEVIQNWKTKIEQSEERVPSALIDQSKNQISSLAEVLLMTSSSGKKQKLKDISLSDEETQTLKGVHNEVVGHLGVAPTVERLKEIGCKWQYMQEKVELFIRQCDGCQKHDFRKRKHNTAPFSMMGKVLMAHRTIDTIGPLPEDKEGNTFIIAIIDDFSRWLELYKAKSNTALEAANALYEHYGRFGVPRKLHSDRGKEFGNELIKHFNQLVGLQHHELGTAYSHQENTMIERANKEVRRFIMDVVYNRQLTKDSWSKDMPLVQRINNSTPKQITTVSPAYMLYAGGINLNEQLFPPNTNSIQAQVDNLRLPWAEWIQQRMIAQRVVIEQAVANTEKHQQEHAITDTGMRSEYPIDSWVLKGYATDGYGKGRPSKLHMNYTGPFQVKEIQGSAYKLFDPRTGKVLEPCPIQLLKKYEFDAKRVDPLKVRLKDSSDDFIVEEIRGHHGRLQRKREVTFDVKWEGSDEITIEPWENVRDNEILHDYLISQGKSSLIPKQYR